jgi:hypothetical protein
MRCTSACTPVGAANASSYVIATADVGAILRVYETASNDGGRTSVWSSGYVGPITSDDAGSSVLGASAAQVLNAHGQPLATASFGAAVFHAQLAAAARRGITRTVSVRRVRGVKGSLKAWACPVSPGPGGAPQACSRSVRLRGTATATMALPAGSTGRVRVVVVRR